MSSIKVERWTKESTLLGMSMHSAEVTLVRRLAFSFSSLGTWMNLAYSSPTRLLSCSRYFFVFSPLHLKLPFTWLVTTWESQYTITFIALTALARSSPSTKASHSTSSFVVWKLRWTMHSISSPSVEWSTTPALPTCLLDNLSVWMIHWGCSSAL